MRKFILIMFMFLFPLIVYANDEDYIVVSQSEKFFKIIIIRSINSNRYIAIDTEISEDEFNNPVETIGNATIETAYKRMTTSILSNGSGFRYQNELLWNTLPKIRSYDTISIGRYSSVKTKNINFSQTYCTSVNDCYTDNDYSLKKFANGVGVTFLLPSGNYISLGQKLYFDVEKDVDATILKQIAVGDYAHAVKSISLSNALNYSVNIDGLSLKSSIKDYYDEINYAQTSWSGSW